MGSICHHGERKAMVIAIHRAVADAFSESAVPFSIFSTKNPRVHVLFQVPREYFDMAEKMVRQLPVPEGTTFETLPVEVSYPIPGSFKSSYERKRTVIVVCASVEMVYTSQDQALGFVNC
eukprot:CAMPEP_0184725522 /NCGR_PEP_ID=MMETSP0314-20130426/31170_1 /TAXON_ID=38298 /ORGANISM="Rhodella maculata, Strain CCMP 736" /LENGTH=119 /DNA_ID=CAMNT_0027190775 /DNA_START=1 /DNA_END=360 /DNA_ORIENTATION=-